MSSEEKSLQKLKVSLQTQFTEIVERASKEMAAMVANEMKRALGQLDDRVDVLRALKMETLTDYELVEKVTLNSQWGGQGASPINVSFSNTGYMPTKATLPNGEYEVFILARKKKQLGS